MTTNPLGQLTRYDSDYNANLLFRISRAESRSKMGASKLLLFTGYDSWNAYELSWLNSKGKPQVGRLEFTVPCDSQFIVESKSLKMYLNSLNFHKINSKQECEALIKHDLENCLATQIELSIVPVDRSLKIGSKLGFCLDELDITTADYILNQAYLKSNSANIVTEQLFTQLFRSNCPVTNQPDWATIRINYKGPKIDRKGLLKYLIFIEIIKDFMKTVLSKLYFISIRVVCLRS